MENRFEKYPGSNVEEWKLRFPKTFHLQSKNARTLSDLFQFSSVALGSPIGIVSSYVETRSLLS
jgi:hypothetical protein